MLRQGTPELLLGLVKAILANQQSDLGLPWRLGHKVWARQENKKRY
jgi:hypothetical protein